MKKALVHLIMRLKPAKITQVKAVYQSLSTCKGKAKPILGWPFSIK